MATVSSLTEAQVTALSAYLSSPSSIPARKAEETSPFPNINGSQSSSSKASAYENTPASQQSSTENDSLRSLVLESDLRRELRANLSHHRTIGSYVGRRHVAGLPVRGQKTRTNAITAGKLNRIERRGMATFASPTANTKSVTELVQPLLREKFDRD
jgi:small subunit ribosomal protein S13